MNSSITSIFCLAVTFAFVAADTTLIRDEQVQQPDLRQLQPLVRDLIETYKFYQQMEEFLRAHNIKAQQLLRYPELEQNLAQASSAGPSKQKRNSELLNSLLGLPKNILRSGRK